MSSSMRITTPRRLVLAALLERLGEDSYGLEIVRSTGLASGSLYPILQRFENEGWLVSRWEDTAAAADAGRPPRRYYSLTGLGEAAARTRQGAAGSGASMLDRMTGPRGAPALEATT